MAIRPRIGDAYSEYDSRNALVVLADRALAARPWRIDHVDPRYESGSQASRFFRQPDRLDCAPARGSSRCASDCERPSPPV
ncbi:MAG: hypothetical protein ACE15D_09600 [Candidatus Eisenbacteria bacterium]